MVPGGDVRRQFAISSLVSSVAVVAGCNSEPKPDSLATLLKLSKRVQSTSAGFTTRSLCMAKAKTTIVHQVNGIRDRPIAKSNRPYRLGQS
jgi:hypothetical protein